MNKRDKIYVLLLVLTAIGVFVDRQHLLQGIVMIVLCRLWQNEDSAQLGYLQTGAIKFLTIVVPPIGITVYFFESRHWRSAIVAAFMFWLGIAATTIVAAIAAITGELYL